MSCGCFPVVSSWVAWLCVVDGELVVCYTNGACFSYPGLGAGHLQQILYAGSKGRMANGLLKGCAYRRIAPPSALFGTTPIVTDHCPGGVCPRLQSAVTLEYLDIAYQLDFLLVHVPADGVWRGSTECGNETSTLEIWDDPGAGFQYKLACLPQSNLPVSSCDPFTAGGAANFPAACCGHASDNVTVTITVSE